MESRPFNHVSYNQTRYLAFINVTSHRMHRHSFYEACIVKSGTGEFEHEGEIHHLQRGDLFLADPDTFHEIRPSAAADLVLYFLCFFITRHADESRATRQLQLDQGHLHSFLTQHLHHLPEQSHLVPLFEHTMKLMRQKPEYPNNRFYHEATLLLISQVITALGNNITSSRAEYSEQLHHARVVDLIEQKLNQPLRITELAKECGMSERNLRRKWQNWSTRSLLEEINYRRIERACQLLLLPDISVADAGYQVGVRDPAQFSRLFKKIKKCSPGAYRRLHLGNIPGPEPVHQPFQTEFLVDDNSEPAR